MYNLLFLANQEMSDRPLMILTFFTPAWAAIQSQWQAFFISNALLLVTIFWFADIVVGSIKALKDGNFRPSKFVRGVIRWLIWFIALAVAWGIRIGLGFTGNIIASMIEAVIILAEGSSILRNLAYLSDDPRIQKLLGLFADSIEDKVDDIIHKLDDIEEDVKPKEGEKDANVI